MANPVVHFEIAAKDSVKSRQFYQDLFGWEIQVDQAMNYGLIAPAGDKSIGGGIGPLQPGVTPYVTFYVLVDDLQVALDKAAKLGGKVTLPPTPIPGVGSSAMFTDPDGNVIGLFKSL
jgi:hypothetical protein